MKKLLMLGGAFSQVPAIKRAKEQGFWVITCDYLPENPGHQFADEYVNVSTTDKDAVLEIVREKEIDGIIAYASDPAAQTAAYVAEKMGLPGSRFDAVKILSEKDEFRKFQKKHGFECPKFLSLAHGEKITLDDIVFPCFVKPVDSSGSKGVTQVFTEMDLNVAIEEAMKISRAKRVIIEGKIDSPFHQLHGDGFVENGELIFLELGDQRFRGEVPIGTSCPSAVDTTLLQAVKSEINLLLKKCGYQCGAINAEVRIGHNGEIYILEIGPRSGGNYVPQLMQEATGFNEVDACILCAMGELSYFEQSQRKYVLQYIIGSSRDGIFSEIWMSEYIKPHIRQFYLHKKEGDFVGDYHSSNNVVGVALIEAASSAELDEIVANIGTHIQVVTKEEVYA